MSTQLMDQAEQARDAVAAAAKPLLHDAKRAAAAARLYTHPHTRARPWAALGVAISAGVLLGFLAYRATR